VSTIPPSKKIARTAITISIIACFIVPLLFAADGVQAETYVFDGSARSQVRITQTTTIQISGLNTSAIANGSKIIFNATYPSSSNVNGYTASYSSVQIDATPAPSRVSDIMTDAFENKYKQYEWAIDKNTSSSFSIVVTTRFNADITGDLGQLSYADTIGTDAYPEYRSPTGMVQSGDPAIVSKKNELLAGATSESDAVDKIINFVKTNIPTQDEKVDKDAISSLNSPKGNCVNRAHLAMALLRSAGIPARCVSGSIYGDKYSVSYPAQGGTATTEVTWGSGSHVWIEVYYPGEGTWIPYDAFMDKGFVDSRHVKMAVSNDFDPGSPSTRGDAGMLLVYGAAPKVNINTAVSSANLVDSIALHYRYKELTPPAGIFMIGRQMQVSDVPTATPTIIPTPTPLPNNTTVTPTIRPNQTTKTPTPKPPTPTPTFDYAKHNVSGAIVDASTGVPISGATVMLDTMQLSASDTGMFTFLYGVADASYTLTVSAPGYMTQKEVIMPHNADMEMTVRLVPLAVSPSPSPTPKPSPSVDMLAALAALACGAILRRKTRP
jgi:transglutaminase-like putative cysteine protease/outer membrane lipoprotein-sorting protein